jgi:hypothetical protein
VRPPRAFTPRLGGPVPVYHLEIREFPRNLNRFNMNGAEIGAIVLPWVQDKVIELEEQRWSPHEAILTILEGPEIAVQNLSMGRGWPTALREGQDVTRRIVDEARQALADGSAGAPAPAPGPAPAASPPAPSPAPGSWPGADQAAGGDQLALGVELGGLLGGDAARLLAAWRSVVARSSGLAPSESLALAERELGAGNGQAT